MIDGKSGNIKFDFFFDDAFGTASTRTTHRTKPRLHVMLWWRSRNLRASISRQSIRGPNLRVRRGLRSASARTTEPSADYNRYVANKRLNDLFSLVGQIVKNTNSKKENQGVTGTRTQRRSRPQI